MCRRNMPLNSEKTFSFLKKVNHFCNCSLSNFSGLRNSASETAEDVLTAPLKTCPSDSFHYTSSSFKIHKMDFSLFR